MICFIYLLVGLSGFGSSSAQEDVPSVSPSESGNDAPTAATSSSSMSGAPTVNPLSKLAPYGPIESALAGKYIAVFAPRTSAQLINLAMEQGLAGVQGAIRGSGFNASILAESFSVDPGDFGDIEASREFIAEQLEALLESEFVLSIEEQQNYTTTNNQQYPPSWGIDRIDEGEIDSNYHYDYTGAGVKLYILDTGIRSTHEDFGGRVTCGFNAFEGSEDCGDYNGHGTHVAGTAGGRSFGVAKEVDLITVKVLDGQGFGSTEGVIEGIEYVAQQARTQRGPHVANLSLGGFFSMAINRAVQGAVDSGVFFAVAAGNEDQDACSSSPASAARAMTVGSTARNDARSYFSNYGECVDIFAPGEEIVSARHTSNTQETELSGTSMACPHVAGVAALYYQRFPDADPDRIFGAIVGDAIQGAVSDTRGSPDLFVTVGGIAESEPSPPPFAAASHIHNMAIVTVTAIVLSALSLFA